MRSIILASLLACGASVLPVPDMGPVQWRRSNAPLFLWAPSPAGTYSSPTANTGQAISTSRASSKNCTVDGGTAVATSGQLCIADGPAARIEQQTVHLELWSEALDNAVWTLNSGMTVTPNAAPDRDGAMTMDLVDNRSASIGFGMYQIVTDFSPTHTHAVDILPFASGDSETVGVACTGGATATLCTCGRESGAACTARISTSNCYATGVFTGLDRMWAEATCSAGSSQAVPFITPGNSTSANGRGYFGHTQFETRTWPSTYSKTTSAQVTVNADVVSTLGTVGILSWTKEHGDIVLSPDWAAANSFGDHPLGGDGTTFWSYNGTAKTFSFTRGTATATSAVQSFAERTAHTLSWRYIDGERVCLTVDAQAEVCTLAAYASPLPGVTLYLGGNSSTGASASFSRFSAYKDPGAQIVDFLPAGATYAYLADNIDGASNAGITDGMKVNRWKRDLTLSTGVCPYCIDMVNDAGPEMPLARANINGSHWALTGDGIFDNLSALQSDQDDTFVVNPAIFEKVILARPASSRASTPYGSGIVGQGWFGTVANTVTAAGGLEWKTGDAGFTIGLGKGSASDPLEDTDTNVVATRGAFGWASLRGTGSALEVSSDLITYESHAFTGSLPAPGSPGGVEVLFNAQVGGGGTGAQNNFDGDIAAAALYPRMLTSFEHQQMQLWRARRYSTASATLVACLGDSITAGYESATDIPWPKRIELIKGPTYQVANFGKNGDETPTALGRWRYEIKGHGYSTLIVLLGVNDVKNGGTSLATTKANLDTIYREALAEGMTVIALTLLPWKSYAFWNSSLQANTDSLNSYIRNEVVDLSLLYPGKIFLQDAALRYGNDVSMPFGHVGGDPLVLSPTCDLSDGLHPKDPCVPDIASWLAPVVP